MKKIGVLFLLFAGLTAFVYFYEIEGEKKREEARELEESLFQMKKEEITQVEIEASLKDLVRLQKDGERWVLKSPVETLADEETVDSLVRNIGTAKIERNFEQGGENAAAYGLSEPRLKLKVKAGEREKTLRVGANDYIGNQVYVQFEGQSQVYLTSDYMFTTADKEVIDWRSKKVLHFNRNKARIVEINRPAGRLRLRKQEDQWLIEEPLQEPADGSSVSSLLSSLAFAEAERFVAEEAGDGAPYGLDSPPIMVRIQQEGEDSWETLQLGEKDPEGEGYLAQNPDRSPVFAVKKEIYDKLTQDLWELRNREVMDVEQDQVAKVAIRRGQDEILLKQEDLKWTVEKPDSHKGKEALAYKFWYPIDDLRFETIEDEEDGFPQADVQVVLTLKDGSSRQFEFTQSGDGAYRARRTESGRQGSISKESFEKLKFEIDDIVS